MRIRTYQKYACRLPVGEPKLGLTSRQLLPYSKDATKKENPLIPAFSPKGEKECGA